MTHTFIVVNRIGGLGNQLFQYAAARIVAHEFPAALIYVEEEKENTHNHKNYDYAAIFMKHAIVNKDLSCPFEFHQLSSFHPWQPKDLCLPIKLCGYFQYLPAIQPIMKDLILEYKEALQPFIPNFVNPRKSVFVHVRRGDYLHKQHYHYIQTIRYYENAFQEWRKRYTGDFQLFMISDDPLWCRNQTWSFPYILYENQDEIQTLAVMSQCQAGAIIANSTFSYWGALLSQSPHVFYPEKWIADQVYELFPSHWCCVNG